MHSLTPWSCVVLVISVARVQPQVHRGAQETGGVLLKSKTEHSGGVRVGSAARRPEGPLCQPTSLGGLFILFPKCSEKSVSPQDISWPWELTGQLDRLLREGMLVHVFLIKTLRLDIIRPSRHFRTSCVHPGPRIHTEPILLAMVNILWFGFPVLHIIDDGVRTLLKDLQANVSLATG